MTRMLDPNEECRKGNHLASSDVGDGMWKCVWCGTIWKHGANGALAVQEVKRADAV